MITQLYKKDRGGKIQQWTIETRFEKFRTTEGYVDGALTTTEWTTCKGKRAGAANATTGEEQALKEAEAKVKKQRDKGWADNIESIEAAKPKIAAMLAFEKDKYIDHLESLEEVVSQPKLDGIRNIATIDGQFSRNGKPFPCAPHIWEEVQELFEEIESYWNTNPKSVKFDGEFYNHDLKADFNAITSIVRKQSPTALDLEKSKELLQYHLYDIDIPNLTFRERYDILWSLLDGRDYKYLRLVETTFMDNTLDDRNEKFAQYIEQGYEGQMLRNPESKYDNFRSKNLLKHKEFMEEEFMILDIEEGVGNRSGMMGRIKLEMADGKKFDANSRGTHDYFRELLKNKLAYIGKMATIRFQNYTPNKSTDQDGDNEVDCTECGGVPRFPVMIAIRDYE